MAVATRELVGSGGSVWRVRERRSRGGGKEFGRVREFQGGGVARMEASGVSRWSGKQEVAGACAGVRRPRACAYWREEEGNRGRVEMGWAVLGQVGYQVSAR